MNARARQLPDDVVLPGGKIKMFVTGTDRLVRRGEYFAAVLIFDVNEAARMVCIVGLLRLHEGFRFQIGRVRIFGRLRLHKLRYGVDRKSTRLNSSHVAISYSVFCL